MVSASWRSPCDWSGTSSPTNSSTTMLSSALISTRRFCAKAQRLLRHRGQCRQEQALALDAGREGRRRSRHRRPACRRWSASPWPARRLAGGGVHAELRRKGHGGQHRGANCRQAQQNPRRHSDRFFAALGLFDGPGDTMAEAPAVERNDVRPAIGINDLLAVLPGDRDGPGITDRGTWGCEKAPFTGDLRQAAELIERCEFQPARPGRRRRWRCTCGSSSSARAAGRRVLVRAVEVSGAPSGRAAALWPWSHDQSRRKKCAAADGPVTSC